MLTTVDQNGKEVLIKTVAQAIPSHCMSVFRLPSSICLMLNKQIMRYWWGRNTSKGIPWKKWTYMCKHKEEGGLGFRDFHCFNQALLAKMAWRLHTEPDSLSAQILRAKYHSCKEFLYAPRTNGGSYIWSSILWGRDLLKQGLIRRIGDGRETNVVGDWWIPIGLKYRPHAFEMIPRNWKVCTLITATGGWNEELLDSYFTEEEIVAIHSIAPSLAHGDKLSWFYDKNGRYNVKSGYRVALSLDVNMQELGCSSSMTATNSFWRKIWKAPAPPKSRLFLWRACQNVLPTKLNLIQRRMDITPLCHRCSKRPESVTHALWECKRSRDFWRVSMFADLLQENWQNFESLVDHAQQQKGPQELGKFATFSSVLWEERNRQLYGHTETKPELLLEMASRRHTDFEWSNAGQVVKPTTQVEPWKPPKQGHLKLNVDGAANVGRGRCGLGAVLRDDKGMMLWACMQPGPSKSTAFISELLSLRMGLTTCLLQDMKPSEVVTDNVDVEQCINLGYEEWHPYAALVAEIKNLCSVLGVDRILKQHRSTNKVADRLAREAARTNMEQLWDGAGPPWLETLIHEELVF